MLSGIIWKRNTLSFPSILWQKLTRSFGIWKNHFEESLLAKTCFMSKFSTEKLAAALLHLIRPLRQLHIVAINFRLFLLLFLVSHSLRGALEATGQWVPAGDARHWSAQTQTTSVLVDRHRGTQQHHGPLEERCYMGETYVY